MMFSRDLRHFATAMAGSAPLDDVHGDCPLSSAIAPAIHSSLNAIRVRTPILCGAAIRLALSKHGPHAKAELASEKLLNRQLGLASFKGAAALQPRAMHLAILTRCDLAAVVHNA
jgi:hypothetical protein